MVGLLRELYQLIYKRPVLVVAMEQTTELRAFLRDTATHATLTGPTPNELVFFYDRMHHEDGYGKLILRRYDNVHVTTIIDYVEDFHQFGDDTILDQDVELIEAKLGITVPVILNDDTVYPYQEQVDRDTQQMRDEMRDELPF